MKILRIKIIDGIPCIVLEDATFFTQDNTLCTQDKLQKKPKKLYGPGCFTNFQQSKERAYYDKVLEELKRKFREK